MSDGSGSTTNSSYHEYIFFAGRRVARSDPSSGNVYYFFVDQVGSTRAMTDQNGSVCFQMDYFPYGQENTPAGVSNTCSTNHLFTGYERDPETGLDYAFARYYNSREARFMSADPLSGNVSNPQSLNRYAYVQDNPTSYVDPSGLQCEINGDPTACPAPPPCFYPECGLGPGVYLIYDCVEGGTLWGGGCAPARHVNQIVNILQPPPKPQSQQCTALQRQAGLEAAQLKRNGESLGLLALGGGVVSGLLTGGEEVTAGLDTPLTLTAYHATGSFAALSILDFAASAAFQSYASGGSPSALENFAWDRFASLAAGAAFGASKIPFVSRFAEPLADLAGHAAALANQAEGGCQ